MSDPAPSGPMGGGADRLPTVHVATVHWRDDRFVDVQLRFLRRYVEAPLRVYAFLNHLPDGHADKFFYTSSAPIKSHAVKLNLLADMICFAADTDDDWIVFLDGDAFPIAPVRPALTGPLKQRGLVAVRREEKGAHQPSPCFCVTTVGLWRDLGGDWQRIGNPTNENRAHRSPSDDVGGRILRALDREGIEWDPLLRTNTWNPHRLFHGVYGDLVYHHGAGFRPRIDRHDRGRLRELRERRATRVVDYLPNSGFGRALRRRLHPVQRLKREILAEQQRLDDELFDRIAADDQSLFAELASGSGAVAAEADSGRVP
jgi:hypothetical protein